MRALTIFYSLEGNTSLIANAINDELQGEQEIPSKGFRKYLWGGKQVLFGEKPEINDVKIDFSQYDIIVFGTPIWASNFVPVFNIFFEKYSIKNKKIALFCCHGGGKEGKAFIKFKEQLQGNHILGEMAFKDPLKKDRENNILNTKSWIKSIIK